MEKFKKLIKAIGRLTLSHYRLIPPMILIAAIVIAALIWLNRDNSIGIETSNESVSVGYTRLESIRNIGEWEFLSVSDEEIVDTIRRGFFGDDNLVRIYYGTLRLGVNLRETKPGWITTDKDTVVARLPKVRLLDEDFIDETRTRSFFAEGKWTAADYKALYMKAYHKMRERCLTESNLKSAENNAAEQFSNLLHSMGYEYVRIEWEQK